MFLLMPTFYLMLPMIVQSSELILAARGRWGEPSIRCCHGDFGVGVAVIYD